MPASGWAALHATSAPAASASATAAAALSNTSTLAAATEIAAVPSVEPGWVWVPESPQPPVDPKALNGAEAEVSLLRMMLSQVKATNSALRAEVRAALGRLPPEAHEEALDGILDEHFEEGEIRDVAGVVACLNLEPLEFLS